MLAKDDLHLSISNPYKNEPAFTNASVFESQSYYLDLEKSQMSQIELVPLEKESHQLSMQGIDMSKTFTRNFISEQATYDPKANMTNPSMLVKQRRHKLVVARCPSPVKMENNDEKHDFLHKHLTLPNER